MDTNELASHILTLIDNFSESEDLDSHVEIITKIIHCGLENE